VSRRSDLARAVAAVSPHGMAAFPRRVEDGSERARAGRNAAANSRCPTVERARRDQAWAATEVRVLVARRRGEGMRRPSFIIAGTLPSGTGHLYGLLRQHPEIYLPAVMQPECNFFCKSGLYEKGIEYYLE